MFRTRRRSAFRCIVITGASSGLGAGLARSYAAPGCILGLIGRDVARLNSIADACRNRGAVVHTALLDLTEAAPIEAWLTDLDSHSPVDLVIACAGSSAGTRPDGQPEGGAAATAMVRSNLLGSIHTIEPLLPRFVARGRGHFAVVASVAAYRGLPDSPGYCASKAGVRAYGEALRAALAPRGIRVTVITPGFFTSPMSERFLGPKPFLIPLEDAVRRIRLGLDRKHRRIGFPWQLRLLLQAIDLLPAALGDRLIRWMPFRIAAQTSAAGFYQEIVSPR